MPPPRGMAPPEGFHPPEGELGPPPGMGGLEGYGASAMMGVWRGSMSEQAGQDAARALFHLEGIDTLGQLVEFLQQNTTETTQQAANQTTQIADGISTKEQLRTIETGIFHYEFNGASGSFRQTVRLGSPVDIPGKTDVRIVVDFGTRVFGTSGSYVRVNNTTSSGGTIDYTEPIGPHSFSTEIGPAFGVDASANNVLPVDIALRNVSGVVARTATVTGHYNNELVVGQSSRSEGDLSPSIVMNREPGP